MWKMDKTVKVGRVRLNKEVRGAGLQDWNVVKKKWDEEKRVSRVA